MRLTLELEQDDGKYVASCYELGVASSGETISDALQNIADATALYIETLQEEGLWPPFSLQAKSLQKRLKRARSVVELVEICTAIVELSRQQRSMGGREK